jgi:hypothetical protein
MSSNIARQCLPVAEFFACINWQGLETAQVLSASKIGRTILASSKRKLDPTSPQAMCLSVGEFFSLCNWQGETVDRHIGTGTYSDVGYEPEETIAFSFTLPVQQLFSLVNWDGKLEAVATAILVPTVSPQAKPEVVEAVEVDRPSAIIPPADDTEISLNDLSSLF